MRLPTRNHSSLLRSLHPHLSRPVEAPVAALPVAEETPAPVEEPVTVPVVEEPVTVAPVPVVEEPPAPAKRTRAKKSTKKKTS